MTPTPTVVLLGALDTKGEEYSYVATALTELGCDIVLIDTGVLGEPQTPANVTRAAVARSAGRDLGELQALGDRNEAMGVMAAGAAAIVAERRAAGGVDAVLAIGGSNAGYVMSAVGARLPVGVPKLLVSTIAAGDTRPYVAGTDLTLMYPVVDIGGLNRISRQVLTNAAHACAGMAHGTHQPDTNRARVVAVTMFGVTTTGATKVREVLSADGAEVLTFHATGVGGQSMEALIRSGQIDGVVDLTTTELADDLVGGVCSAGPDRLRAAAEHGTPQVVSLGALDMVNFGAPETVPPQYAGRLLHQHNPAVTLMRTSPEECAELGRRLAEKLNASTGPCAVLVPTKGFSQISALGQIFHDPAADAALIDSLVAGLNVDVTVQIFDSDINDPELATAAAEILIDWLKEQ